MTKALHVCRHLHAAGWRVVLVETFKYWHVGSRLSNSVDAFHRVPIPELHPENYAQAIAGEWHSPQSATLCRACTVTVCDSHYKFQPSAAVLGDYGHDGPYHVVSLYNLQSQQLAAVARQSWNRPLWHVVQSLQPAGPSPGSRYWHHDRTVHFISRAPP